jgi:hypothetical protein
MANAAGVAAIGAVFFDRIESVEPGEDVCAADYRLRRILDVDASGHGVTD